MPRSAAVDGFRLAYERPAGGDGARPAVLLLHGWPGDRHDWREVVARLSAELDLIVPDLRGFGDSDVLDVAPREGYGAAAQARSLLGLLDELGLGSVVIGGYDIGSRTAQYLAGEFPQRVSALVLSPPMPGVGDRVLGADQMREFWYQSFHRLELPAALLDGRADAVRAYLRHFWSHWSGPGYVVDEAQLDRLAGLYGRPGALLASIAWYRAGSGTVAAAVKEQAPALADRLTTPLRVLWPEHDPLFPVAWSDCLDAFFADVALEHLPGVGHFTPLEAPERFAAAIREACGV
jgi:pimeloyl-ACP methyl ester carboxylesterase